MEVENKKLSPWLVFQHGRRERTQTFFNMADRNYRVRSTRQMRKKDVKLSYHDWLLLEDSSGRFCMFNLVSLVEIKLPQLTKEHQDCIYVFSVPPTDRNCKLIVIRTSAPIIYFCRITEDNEFSEARFSCLESISDNIIRAISYEGKIYFITYLLNFGVIDFDMNDCHPTLADLGELKYHSSWYFSEEYLVESCGELFIVRLIFHWPNRMVSDVLVCKMDFSQMLWVEVESIDDRCFFLSESGSLSSSAFELGLEGGQIFFFFEGDISLYSYRMKERSISVDLTCPNVKLPWKSPFWIMYISCEVKANMEKMENSDVHVKVDMENSQQINAYKKAGEVKTAKEISMQKTFVDKRPWSNLPIEIVMLIARSLHPVAFAHMRSVCKSWRSIVPNKWLPVTPCLIFQEEKDGLYKLFDPLSKRVYATSHIPELHGTNFHYSKGGWLLVSLDGTSEVFFFNPFSKERINLPCFQPWSEGPYSTLSFSSIPTSSDCIVFSIYNQDPFDNIYIGTCSPGDEYWSWYGRWKGINPPFRTGSTNAVFHNGLFYCVGLQGNLGVFNVSEYSWKVLKKPKPLQLPWGCCFLIEYEGELVLVYTRRTQIRIFTLDQTNMEWVDVEGLDDLTLFLNRSTSLAMRVDKEATAAVWDMNNKIYSSRFRQDSSDTLIYTMESKSHQLNFYRSKEFLKCTWIEPIGYEFGLDSQGNVLSIISRFR